MVCLSPFAAWSPARVTSDVGYTLPSRAMGADLSHALVQVGERRDQAAFSLLCRELAPRLMVFVRARGVPDPESVVQEVMLTVWRKASTYDPARASASTWVFAIARNRAIDSLRTARRPEPDPSDPAFVEVSATTSVQSPDEAAEQASWRAALASALSRLPDEQREVITRMYVHGETFAVAAASLGIAVGTAKSRGRLALATLRAHLNFEVADA